MSNLTREKVFICYARADKRFVDRLCAQLKRAGIPSWRDASSIPMGAVWRNSISKALRESFYCLVVLSPRSAKSHYVTHEWSFAMGMGKRVVPLALPGVKPAMLHPKLSELQFVDFTERTRWAHLLAPLGAKPMESALEAAPGTRTRIRAQFELANGKPIKGPNNEYSFTLSIENPPPNAKQVTYEIHDDTFLEPVWKERNANEAFRSECSSYGDILISATFKGGDKGTPVETMLYDALLREHGSDTSKAMKQALKDIRDN